MYRGRRRRALSLSFCVIQSRFEPRYDDSGEVGGGVNVRTVQYATRQFVAYATQIKYTERKCSIFTLLCGIYCRDSCEVQQNICGHDETYSRKSLDVATCSLDLQLYAFCLYKEINNLSVLAQYFVAF